MLLQVKGLIQLLSSSGLKKIYAHFYHPPDILLRGTKYWAPNIVCVALAKKGIKN